MPRFENPPYYISAYGLAVKRGFAGTLDEWLASLRGMKGDKVELRYENSRIRWRWVTDGGVASSEWMDLMKITPDGGVIAEEDIQAIVQEYIEENLETIVLQGEQGATFTPAVDAGGNLSWSNDKGLSNPKPVNIMGPAGKTPVKGTDYYTDSDKAEMVEDVLAELPISDSGDGYTDISGLRQATAMSVVREGGAITVTTTLQGGKTSISVITLDENDYPVSITTDGVECAVSWEGFDG